MALGTALALAAPAAFGARPVPAPLYAGQYLLWGLGMVGVLGLAVWLGRRLLKLGRGG